MSNDEAIESLLKKHIENLNLYDLERLNDCFKYEYQIHPEKEACIRDILEHIQAEMDKRAAEMGSTTPD